MKVSISWLKELVDSNISVEELINLLPLRSVSIKEVTDKYIELDMKGYNRADLLSMRGVAREVAAITDSQIIFQEPDNNLSHVRRNVDKVNVKIEDRKLCPVYCIAKIEGLKVEPSKADWVKKLGDSGIRSINNIADLTNLIMLEFGQPMHAFDASIVADETILVRTAKVSEEIVTLDGKTRKLSGEDLLIADPKKILGIAGVMGGKDSEISDSTTTILLEAAIFDPVSIRRTSTRHGLYSEASKRFQHGLTKTNLLQALAAAIKMYENLGGRFKAIAVVGDIQDKPKTVRLTQEKINSLIGIEIASEFVEESFKKLHFKLAKSLGVVSGPPPRWDVVPPYWRLDIKLQEDLIEEIARMYGYEKIPARKLSGEIPKKIDQRLFNLIYNLKTALVNIGLTEVQTYSFYGSKTINDLGFRINELVKIANPISTETEYLRDNIWPNLIEVVAKNLKQGYKDIAIFEIGKVYNPEKYHLAIALMNGGNNPMLELSSISKGVNLPQTRAVQLEDRELFHPTRFIPPMAEIHPRILNKFGIEKRVAILEIGVEALV